MSITEDIAALAEEVIDMDSVEAEYRPVIGPAPTDPIDVMHVRTPVERDGDQMTRITYENVLAAKTSEVPNAREGDIFVIGSVTYRAAWIMGHTNGQTEIALEVAA